MCSWGQHRGHYVFNADKNLPALWSASLSSIALCWDATVQERPTLTLLHGGLHDLYSQSCFLHIASEWSTIKAPRQKAQFPCDVAHGCSSLRTFFGIASCQGNIRWHSILKIFYTQHAKHVLSGLKNLPAQVRFGLRCSELGQTLPPHSDIFELLLLIEVTCTAWILL